MRSGSGTVNDLRNRTVDQTPARKSKRVCSPYAVFPKPDGAADQRASE